MANDEEHLEEGVSSNHEDTEEIYEPVGEPIEDKDNFINNIFNTKNRIDKLKHRLRGDLDKNGVWEGSEHSLAPESFINKQIGSMESIIDTVNSFSKKNDKEIRKILHGAVAAFILDMANEPDIDHKDHRSLAKAYEHSLELFLGLVEFGHGAKVLTALGAGIGGNFEPIKKEGKIQQWLNR